MAYGDTFPVLNGTTLRRPSAVSESPEALRSSVTLSGGSTRAYSSGVRFVVELSWNKLLEAEVNALEAAAAPAFVSYTHVDGAVRVVETSAVDSAPIAGTYPVRFTASVTLRAQDPDR